MGRGSRMLYILTIDKVKVLVSQLCLTFCGSMDCSLPGSSVPGILQARKLEWMTIPFSRGSSWPRDQTHVSCITGRFLTIWATREAPLDYVVHAIPIHFAKFHSIHLNECIYLLNLNCTSINYMYMFMHIYIYNLTLTCVYTCVHTSLFPFKKKGVKNCISVPQKSC